MSRQKVWLAVVVMGLATAVALLPPGSGQQIAAFLLLWVVPIPLVASVLDWRLESQRPVQSRSSRALKSENWLIAAGLVLLIHPLFALLVHYLPGPIPTWLLLLFAVFLPLLCLAAPPFRRSFPFSSRFSLLILPLLLSLLLRLPNMGYKEIQGDEGVILVRAAAALTGDDAELFLHQKGPMEILLPLMTWGVTGAFNEFWARLPFLWAGLLGVAAVTLLARRWFNGRVAFIAGLLFAIMGLGIAFSRIIQYQTLVMLWGLLALLTATRYREERRPLDLYVTAVFLAGGLLAHYDAVLVVPAVGWVLGSGERGVARGEWLVREWAIAGLLGAGVLGLFYVPFALNPNFGRTVRYLLNDRVGTQAGLTDWSGTAVWQMMTFYNSTYFIVGLIGLLLVGLWRLWRHREGGSAVLTFLVPAFFYVFVVSDPRTHVYTIFPGAIILAAVGATTVDEWLQINRWFYRAGLVAGLMWFVVSAVYVYLMFVEVTPERQRTWAENRPSLYPTTWDEPPLFGLFGFPHQAGWRMVSGLLGNEFGTYASNEEEEITTWYMRQAPRTHCANFDQFIWVANAQDEVPYEPDWLQNLQAEVWVNGEVTLQVYGRQAVSQVARVVANGRQQWLTPQDVAPPINDATFPVDVVLGEQVRLLGYDLDTSQAHPGGQVIVTLYWQALLPFARNYQVFTHLYNGRMLGQHDGAPECGINPTTRWEPGQIISDPHLIPIVPDAPLGPVSLFIGMYDLLDASRLTIPGSPDNALHLTDIVLEDK